MANEFMWKTCNAHLALKETGYYVWDSTALSFRDAEGSISTE